jgi:hypothetical protein
VSVNVDEVVIKETSDVRGKRRSLRCRKEHRQHKSRYVQTFLMDGPVHNMLTPANCTYTHYPVLIFPC